MRSSGVWLTAGGATDELPQENDMTTDEEWFEIKNRVIDNAAFYGISLPGGLINSFRQHYDYLIDMFSQSRAESMLLSIICDQYARIHDYYNECDRQIFAGALCNEI